MPSDHVFPSRPHARDPGDPSGEATPVPIPNTVVKLSSAEDTQGAAPRENRPSPGSFAFLGAPHSPAGSNPRVVAESVAEQAATADRRVSWSPADRFTEGQVRVDTVSSACAAGSSPRADADARRSGPRPDRPGERAIGLRAWTRGDRTAGGGSDPTTGRAGQRAWSGHPGSSARRPVISDAASATLAHGATRRRAAGWSAPERTGPSSWTPARWSGPALSPERLILADAWRTSGAAARAGSGCARSRTGRRAHGRRSASGWRPGCQRTDAHATSPAGVGRRRRPTGRRRAEAWAGRVGCG